MNYKSEMKAKLEHDINNIAMILKIVQDKNLHQDHLNAIKERLERCYNICKDIEFHIAMNAETQVIDLTKLHREINDD